MIKKNFSKNIFSKIKRINWIVLLGWILALGLCITLNLGKVLIVLFPAGALALGLFYYLTSPEYYLGFTWSIIFAAPLIKRIIDYVNGYVTPGPWDLTARIVAFVSVLTLIRYLPRFNKEDTLFIICAASIFYGFILAIINAQRDLDTLIYIFIGWIDPVLIGFHLSKNWPRYLSFSQTTRRCFLWGTLLLGLYGIIQFVFAPSWDAFYIINSEAKTLGSPEPFGIRVFSTMGSPHEYAMTTMAGLLLLLVHRSKYRFIALGTGLLGLLLTVARGPWLGFAFGSILLISLLKEHLQIRFILNIVLVILLATPIIIAEPFNTVIFSRFSSVSNIENDVSLQVRAGQYSQIIDLALSEFVGRGLETPDNILNNDSGVTKTLLSLGWIGTIPYLSGFFVLLSKVFEKHDNNTDIYLNAFNSIIFGIVIQFALIPVFDGSIGILIWGFIGMRIASNHYYFSRL
ncbi:MAG: Glucose-6-phosphate isomerase [Chloroflexi bacterium AL-N5]|nr:Glucose-6-phosphate isomerase [Chloroflexi bacterium AL-N5]